jgi:hypothetical protein
MNQRLQPAQTLFGILSPCSSPHAGNIGVPLEVGKFFALPPLAPLSVNRRNNQRSLREDYFVPIAAGGVCCRNRFAQAMKCLMFDRSS